LNRVDGRIVKEVKTTNIEGFKKHFGIKTTNRIVGHTPNYVGFRPSRGINFNNVILKIVNKNFYEIKTSFPRIFNNLKESIINFREVFSGSYDSNSGHIKEFMKDDLNKFTAEEILIECKDSPWLKSPHLNFNDISDLPYITNFNPKSHSGHYSSRILSSKNKGVTIMPAILLAFRKFELIKKYAIKNFTLWDVFAREKDMKSIDNKNLEPSTRLVLSTEHYEILLLSYFFQKLMVATESFSETKYHIRSEYDGTKAFNIYCKSQDYDYVIDADWPKFDSSIDSEYLLATGAIMFSNCIDTRESLRVIFHLVSSFITKYVVIPPGIVVELNRGNPSGHPGVTAINCYVNIIRWIQIGRRIYGENYWEYMDIEVYGDDAYVFLKQHSNLHKVDTFVRELGFSDIDIYSRLFPTSLIMADVESSPDFLKRKISINGLCWNTTKVFDKIFYQSRVRTIYEQIDLIKSFVTTGPGDAEFNDLMKYLVIEIEKEFLENRTNTIDQIESFLNNVRRYDLCDKSYLKNKFKTESVLRRSSCIYLLREQGLEKVFNYNWFKINILKSYFLICENGIFTKYIRSIWKNDKERQKIIFEDFEYKILDFNNEDRAKKDFYIGKLKGT